MKIQQIDKKCVDQAVSDCFKAGICWNIKTNLNYEVNLPSTFTDTIINRAFIGKTRHDHIAKEKNEESLSNQVNAMELYKLRSRGSTNLLGRLSRNIEVTAWLVDSPVWFLFGMDLLLL